MFNSKRNFTGFGRCHRNEQVRSGVMTLSMQLLSQLCLPTNVLITLICCKIVIVRNWYSVRYIFQIIVHVLLLLPFIIKICSSGRLMTCNFISISINYLGPPQPTIEKGFHFRLHVSIKFSLNNFEHCGCLFTFQVSAGFYCYWHY